MYLIVYFSTLLQHPLLQWSGSIAVGIIILDLSVWMVFLCVTETTGNGLQASTFSRPDRSLQ